MSTILETHQDPNYEPSHSEIVEYGKWLGMELPMDEHLLWIAREGLKAPLPENWKACKSEKGELYYFNFKSGQSIWDHPLDDHYKKLFRDERANPSERSKPGYKAAQVEAAAAASPKPSPQHADQPAAVVKKASRTNSPSAAVAAAAMASDAPPTSSGAAKSSSSLPPSGKTNSKSAAKLREANTHAALPTLIKGSGGAAAATHAAAAASSGSEDERSSQEGPKLGKLRELKTLKTKKDMPGELRLDALPGAAGAPLGATNGNHNSSANSSTTSSSKFGDPPLTTAMASSWDSKAPLGSSNSGSSAAEKTITVQSAKPGIMSTSSSSSSLTGSREDVLEVSPASDEIAVGAASAAVTSTRSSSRESKRRLVSFSNEEIAVAQDGKQLLQIQADSNSEIERFRAAEAARVQRAKDDHIKALDESLRSSRDAAARKHDEQLRSMESEFKADLQRKKVQLSQQTDDELLRHRRTEEDRMTQRIKALKDDITSHMELAIRNVRDTGVDGGNQFLEAVRAEQRAFSAAVLSGMDDNKRLATEQQTEEVDLLKATLQAEKTALQGRIRELQSDCTAKLSVLKMENAASLAAMHKEFADQKLTIELEHKDDLQRLLKDLRASAEAELRSVKEEYSQRSSKHHPLAIDTAAMMNSSVEDDSLLGSTKPLARFAHPHAHQQQQQHDVSDISAQQGLMDAIAAAEHSSSGESASGSLVELAHSLHAATQTSTPAGAKKAAAGKLSSAVPLPAPLSEKDLGLSNSARTLPPGEDLRSVITEVLRDLFKNSPFILPSPGSQGGASSSTGVSPTSNAAFGREVEPNAPLFSYKGPSSPTAATTGVAVTQPSSQPHPFSVPQAYSTAGAPHAAGGGSSPKQTVGPNITTSTYPTTAHTLQQMNTSVAPESYQEQRQLLVDERRRLQEAKAFVDNQRSSLEERRAQLKSARRHWKADVMDAKAQGVIATSKKGLLLQKVHKVLDKQAVGLQHDDNLLRDSEHWLKTKEQRLVKLEQQFDEHERSRQGAHDMSMASVDTTALLTGYFKPPTPTRTASTTAGGSTTTTTGAAAAATSEVKHTIVGRSAKVSPHMVPSNAAALSSAPGGGGAAAAAAARSISPMLSKALERIERRLDKVAQLVATTSAAAAQAQHSSTAGQQATTKSHHQRSSSDATGGRRSGRTSRSTSRGRHVDFAPTTFSDPWVDISPAMA